MNNKISVEERNEYINKIAREFQKYGFILEKNELKIQSDIRSVQLKFAQITNNFKYSDKVKNYFANSLEEINPLKISPRLELLERGKSNSLKRQIFNYAKSFWSVPISVGFGRRMEYILWDDNTNKVIGIFGLCDPIIGLGVRDDFIGWSREQKKERLYNMLTAYILGAVPPYNQILGAKLVALSAISKQVTDDFYKRYSKNKTIISKKHKPPYLVAIDTMGAFGKSAIYTRLKGWQFIGYTKGHSHIHLTSNGIYEILIEVIKKYGDKTILSKYKYGEGPNYKLRVVSEGLKILGLSKNKLTLHSIKRGYYFAPLAENWKDFLLLKTDIPNLNSKPLEEHFIYWKQRWLPKRIKNL